MVTIKTLTSAFLDYTDNLPVLFVINLFNILDYDICMPTCVAKDYLYCFLSLLNSKKTVRIHQFTDGTTNIAEQYLVK